MKEKLYCKSGGCSAKLGAKKLTHILEKIDKYPNSNLLVGFDSHDDASVYQINEHQAIVSTLDFFPPMVEDPYLFGQIAATNALSDVYAMGGTPLTALNIVCFNDQDDLNILGKIIEGGNDKLKEAKVVLSGGHSIKDESTKYGLSVTGIVDPNKMIQNNGVQVGDTLILTKKLGVGLALNAYRLNDARQEILDEVFKSMTTLNKYAFDVLSKYTLHALTDVTGFGLLVHLDEMLNEKASAFLDKESIPYQTNSDQTVTPLLSGSEVIGLILDDLKNAVGLLKDTDPYFVEEEFSDTDLNYRRFRMNYFAAKGLMARVQLWGGDKEKAAITAKEVIAEGQAEGAEFFPFVTNSEATSSNPDRVFYSEVLFGTYHSSREKLHEDLFAPTLESTSILPLAGTARRDDLYDNENDYRYSVWSTYNKNGTSVLYHRKFEKQDNVTASRQYMIPLIRMSEMYLIAVECCKLGEASVYLNTFRNARNCNSLALTEDNRINILANEYKKEMLGEGQLFFFYKRQEMVNIPDGNQATGTKNVELTKYVVPLPESETDQRISSTDISNE